MKNKKNQNLPELQLLHEIGGDGRERHHFRKVEGLWTCDCGATSDRYGNITPVVTLIASI